MGQGAYSFNEMKRRSVVDEGVPTEINLPLDGFRDPNGDTLLSETLNTALALTQKPVITGATTGNTITWVAADVTKAYCSLALPLEFAKAWRRVATSPNKIRGIIRVGLSLSNLDGATPDGSFNFSCRIYANRITRKNTDGTDYSSATSNIASYNWTAIAKALRDPGGAANLSYNFHTYDFAAVDPATAGYLPEPGDLLHIEVFPATHANNTVRLWGAWLRLNLNGAITTESDRKN